MQICKSYKTELKLNNKQITECLRHAGTARFAYNWGLNQKILAYKNKEKYPTSIDLHKRLNVLKLTDLKWMYGASKCAAQGALRNLDKTFERFFKKTSRFPKFKTKKKGKGSFYLDGTIKVFNDKIQLPKLKKLKLKEKGYLPTNTKIISATVSEHAGKWFVSVLVKEEQYEFKVKKDKHHTVGVDLGSTTLATVSDGEKHENPKPLKRNLKKLRKFNKSIARKIKGSNNRKKAVKKLAKLHYRIANIRKYTLNKITTQLTKTKLRVGIEDLNVKGMMQNRKLARAISDVGFGEFRRQLEYKSNWYNCKIVLVDRFFPSSKMCSVCKKINQDLKLKDREWQCTCGAYHDRDYNAAYNLEQVAASSTETINDCGEVSSGS